MAFPTRPAQPLTLKAAQQQLDDAWAVIDSLRTLHDENEQLKRDNEQLKEDVTELTQRLDTLVEQLGSSSRNSSKPPSSDSPEQKAKRCGSYKKTGRSKGGQPGHSRHERATIPEHEVDQVEKYFPQQRCQCGGTVEIDSKPHYRHQVWDIPPMTMTVEEHQFYRGTCSCCGTLHDSVWPDWLPRGQMGAGLIGWIGMLSGQYHLSMRQIQSLLKEMCQSTFSTGAISKA